MNTQTFFTEFFIGNHKKSADGHPLLRFEFKGYVVVIVNIDDLYKTIIYDDDLLPIYQTEAEELSIDFITFLDNLNEH